MQPQVSLNNEQKAMLSGEKGPAKQMAMRLLLDMSATAGATELIAITSAHLSGVSPLTGGHGLRQFLSRLTADPLAEVPDQALWGACLQISGPSALLVPLTGAQEDDFEPWVARLAALASSTRKIAPGEYRASSRS